MSNSSPNCYVCNKPIPKDRLEALKMLNTPENMWTHVQCSQEQKHKGIYMGETGTSEMKIVNRIYDDSVREVFNKPADACTDDDSP